MGKEWHPPLSLLLHEVVEVVGAAAAAGCDGRRCGRGLPAGVGTEMGERPHRRGLYSLGHLARMLQYLSDWQVEHITAFVKNTSSGWPISRCVFNQQKTKQKSTSTTSLHFTYIFEEKTKKSYYFSQLNRKEGFVIWNCFLFFRIFPSFPISECSCCINYFCCLSWSHIFAWQKFFFLKSDNREFFSSPLLFERWHRKFWSRRERSENSGPNIPFKCYFSSSLVFSQTRNESVCTVSGNCPLTSFSKPLWIFKTKRKENNIWMECCATVHLLSRRLLFYSKFKFLVKKENFTVSRFFTEFLTHNQEMQKYDLSRLSLLQSIKGLIYR